MYHEAQQRLLLRSLPRDGVHKQTGPVVVTTQLYDIGDSAGATTIVTDGYELTDLNLSFLRAVTGGISPETAQPASRLGGACFPWSLFDEVSL